MLLLDSNIFIYAIQPTYSELRKWLMSQNIAASEVSVVEVLGYHQITNEDEQDLQALFGLAESLSVSTSIINQAVTLRQQRKMSLGDAIIAATALEHELTLVTRNTSDFDWISGLNVQNPIKQE